MYGYTETVSGGDLDTGVVIERTSSIHLLIGYGHLVVIYSSTGTGTIDYQHVVACLHPFTSPLRFSVVPLYVTAQAS